ncbi:MAG: choline/carnitine O-acyltransferase, partial [Thermocrispum sp.]
AQELADTEEAVKEFRLPDGPARTLHAALAEYDQQPSTHSWLDLFWPSRYLGRRDRIALNANFFFLFADTEGFPPATPSPSAPEQPQVERAAGLIAAAVHYKVRLDTEAIRPAEQRGRPLSMDQNKYLFATTRIPGAEQDAVRAPYSESEPGPARAQHIVVLYRGNAFRLDVFGPGGDPHSLDDLGAGLQAVMAAGAQRAADPVGQLTTKARAQWAADRAALLAAGNAEAVETIETALFCVALDEAAAEDTQRACDQLLHGDSGNRWFDKAVTFVVFADGRAGINVEHCELDGTTILSFVDDLLGSDPQEHSRGSGARQQGIPAIQPVPFTLTDELRADITAAGKAFADYAAATATQCVSFDDFGSTRAKELGISPDAFVQLAYQLAHRRSKGVTGATYESIATRQWRRGRTEAMRVVTPEVLRFVEAMTTDADPHTRRETLRAAAEAHVARAKDCQAGRAPEQHLWELEWIQRRRGAELGVTEPLALYDSPGWRIMREDYLSTSSAPSAHIQFFGFGMTSGKCIGVAYVLLPGRLNVYLSTPAPVAGQMHAFADHLRTAVAELQELLAAGR